MWVNGVLGVWAVSFLCHYFLTAQKHPHRPKAPTLEIFSCVVCVVGFKKGKERTPHTINHPDGCPELGSLWLRLGSFQWVVVYVWRALFTPFSRQPTDPKTRSERWVQRCDWLICELLSASKFTLPLRSFLPYTPFPLSFHFIYKSDRCRKGNKDYRRMDSCFPVHPISCLALTFTT